MKSTISQLYRVTSLRELLVIYVELTIMSYIFFILFEPEAKTAIFGTIGAFVIWTALYVRELVPRPCIAIFQNEVIVKIFEGTKLTDCPDPSFLAEMKQDSVNFFAGHVKFPRRVMQEQVGRSAHEFKTDHPF